MNGTIRSCAFTLEWMALKFTRSCSESRLIPMMVSAITNCAIWSMLGVYPRMSLIPVLIILSFTAGLTLNASATLILSLYRPIVCIVKLTINDEVTLVYRSWWPRGLTWDDINRYSIETAIESASEWHQAHDRRTSRVHLDYDELVTITEQYLTVPSHPVRHECCPICFEPIVDASAPMLKVCNHRYCLRCISEWFSRGRISCPSCRSDHSNLIPIEILQKTTRSPTPIISVSSVEVLDNID